MPVPEEIRKVPRPVNTVVEETNSKGYKKYVVRNRKSVKYVKGGNPQPHNGEVIGYIYDGAFHPKEETVKKTAKPTLLRYGDAAVVKKVLDDVLVDLCDGVFERSDALKIIAIAACRIINPKASDYQVCDIYKSSYLSVYYPDVALSQNTICKFQQDLGLAIDLQKKFYAKRIARVPEDDHIAVDSMLLEDTSIINTISEYSRKARESGCKDISAMYACHVESMEPICMDVYPGNYPDANCYSSFLRRNNITRGVLVSDKGFSITKIRKHLDENSEIHFITPLKCNDTRIKTNNMTEYDGLNNTYEVYWKKVKIKGGNYLYSFMDPSIAANKIKADALKTKRTGEFSFEGFKKGYDNAGVIVFESDLDLKPEVVYRSYKQRWLLELIFRLFKDTLCLDTTKVHSNSSVRGKNFINFIAILGAARITNLAIKEGLLDKMTYGDLMSELRQTIREKEAPEAQSYDDYWWCDSTQTQFYLMEKLGVCKPSETKSLTLGKDKKVKAHDEPRRPRGRPRKSA